MIEDTRAMSARADGLLAGREASEALQGALQKLSPELRETVILRDLEELEYREIAQVLNVPEGTVKSRLNRGPRGIGANLAEAEGRDMMTSRGSERMYCSDVEILLAEYVDGTLPGKRSPRWRSHLASCAECRELAQDASAAVAFLARTATVEAPPELVTRILFQVPAVRPTLARRLFGRVLGGWLEPVLQPRLAMGMGVTALSFFMLEPRCAS